MKPTGEMNGVEISLKERVSLLEQQRDQYKQRIQALESALAKKDREHEMNLAWRELVEESLRASEEQYRTLVENIGEGVAIVDLNEKFTFTNSQAESIFGVGPGGLIGHSLFEFVNEATREEVLHQTALRIQGSSGSYELEIATEAHEFKTLLVTAVPYPSKSGKVEYVLGIFRDITVRKRYEEKLEDYRHQLQQLATELTLTEERERRTIAQILHDGTGQNLALVMNLLKHLNLKLTTEPQREELTRSIDIIEQTIRSTRSLIYDLSPPSLYKFGLHYALDEHFEKFQSNWNIQAEFFSSQKELELPDDLKVLLFQAARELLVNVAKYAKATLVRGYLYVKEEKLTLLIEDNGSGFKKSDLKRARKERKGFGLFSIGERLQTFGGHLAINTSAKKGTQVTITVPLDAAQKET